LTLCEISTRLAANAVRESPCVGQRVSDQQHGNWTLRLLDSSPTFGYFAYLFLRLRGCYLHLKHRSRSCKFTSFWSYQKPVCDFLLVSNSNLYPVSHHFQYIAEYWSNFRCQCQKYSSCQNCTLNWSNSLVGEMSK